MRRLCLIATGAVLTFATTAAAQQTAPSLSSSSAGLPTVEQQMEVLTRTLDLTVDQRAKMKPILQDLHDATEKLAQDQSLSPDERLAKVRPWRYTTDRKMREILSDEQKKKLDQYEQGPHPEMHGNLTGAPR